MGVYELKNAGFFSVLFSPAPKSMMESPRMELKSQQSEEKRVIPDIKDSFKYGETINPTPEVSQRFSSEISAIINECKNDKISAIPKKCDASKHDRRAFDW